jgi:SAM-dependent methyltransferase
LPDSDFLWNILVCPYCLQPLQQTTQGVFCQSCNTNYATNSKGQIDLRLKRTKEVSVSFTLTPSFISHQEKFDILKMNPDPEGYFGIPFGFTKEFASYIPKARSNNSLMLDMGCGDTRHKSNFTQAGFKYVGIDYDSEKATLLGDGHALPFHDGSFELAFSRSVIEHLQYPFLAIDEVYRTLKPNSKFIGSAAFLEPFHGNSFHHLTHLGLLSCLEHSGFKVEHISPHPKWDVLIAQSSMSLFPNLPNGISQGLVAPLRSLHKTWWRIGKHFNPKADELTRLLWTAGSFMFIASKT